MKEEPYIFAWVQAGSWGVVIILISLFGAADAADLDWRIGGLIGSDHYGSEDVTNEDHRNSFYACANAWCAGRYENSYSTPEKRLYSRFLAYRKNLGQWKGIEFDAIGGGADGYIEVTTNHQISLFVALTAKYSLFKGWHFGRVSAWGWEFDRNDWETIVH